MSKLFFVMTALFMVIISNAFFASSDSMSLALQAIAIENWEACVALNFFVSLIFSISIIYIPRGFSF